MSEVFEYRGVDSLVYAKILTDNNETEGGYETGPVKPLAPVAEIGRTTSATSEPHYYDNQPMIIINSVGADELKLITAVPDLETYAEITGQYYDKNTGSLVEGERTNDYFAIGYRTKGTDGKYRYVWRYKCQFSIPDETSTTETDGADTNNVELTVTCVSTIHKFTKTKASAKAMVTDERKGLANLATFFTQVTTPDTITAATA